MSFRVCQSIRRLLAGDANEPSWSQRATTQLTELRSEYPWVSLDATALVQHPNGEIRWWTFGGGLANTLLADQLRADGDVRSDNLSLRFLPPATLDRVEALLKSLPAEKVAPVPKEEAIENLKFSECLPSHIAVKVFCARYNDAEAVRKIVGELRRVIIES